MKKVLIVSVLLGGLMVGCSQQSQPIEYPTDYYVLKYCINYDKKTVEIRFSDVFKGNKTIACEQLMEMKDITDYSINIYN